MPKPLRVLYQGWKQLRVGLQGTNELGHVGLVVELQGSLLQGGSLILHAHLALGHGSNNHCSC
eukprot:3672491-Prorocentrum_lima.AAC.1